MKPFTKSKRIRKSIFSILLLLAAVNPLSASEITTTGYINVSAEEAMHIINTMQNVIVLDVRDPMEYEMSHLTGSISIPLSGLESAAADLNTKSTLVVYAQQNEGSAAACELLWAKGFKSL